MFYIKVENDKIQTYLVAFLRKAGIGAVSHYVLLHSSKAGIKYGIFHGDDKYTTKESSRLIRLSLYYGLSEEDINEVVYNIEKFRHMLKILSKIGCLYEKTI
jgi:dTDP-4-amino-4,6-dideoxygalactose transaminase